MRRLRLAGVLGVLLLLVSVPTTALAASSIGLSAGNFDFSAASGQVGKGVVVVSNEGDQPVSVRFYASDQVIGPKGEITFVTPTAQANTLQSPASWTTVALPQSAKLAGNVPYMDMQPGAHVPVEFEVKIPDGATPGDHNIILFFETFRPPGAPPQTAGTNVFGRVGTRIRARVQGAISEGIDAAPFRMPSYVIGSAVPYDVTISNSGNVDERVGVKLAQLDSSDSQVASTQIAQDTPVYSGTQIVRSGDANVSATTIGPVHFKLAVTYPSQASDAGGMTKTVEKDRTVWVIPVWLLIGAAVVLVFLFGFALWSGGRRAAENKARRDQEAAKAAALNDEATNSASAE